VPILARAMFGLVNWAARKGLAESSAPETRAAAGHQARRTGVRGETYAYWFLRRNGYVMIARNFTYRGVKGEIDLVGYDGKTLAFVEVKTRTSTRENFGTAEDAVTTGKQRHLSRMARQFVREYRTRGVPFRFDVLAIDALPGRRPSVRLHKGAFAAQQDF
jgi:putative endonuclease